MASRIIPVQNLEKMQFQGVGEYNIPQIEPLYDYDETTKWLVFSNIAFFEKKGDIPASSIGIDFYIHDYKFERLWNNPDNFIKQFQTFRYVCSPDFSIYYNTPIALQIYSVYQKNWVGAYYQMHGIKIIPTIHWGLPQSYDYCFAGMPKNSVISTSIVGVGRKKEGQDIFFMGFDEMVKRLSPTKILFNGPIPKELENDVIPMDQAYKFK